MMAGCVLSAVHHGTSELQEEGGGGGSDAEGRCVGGRGLRDSQRHFWCYSW